jgi:adenine-specific DNA-methyltransferase
MTAEMLMKLSDEVGPNRSLLICCGAFMGDTSQLENLTVKKIPKAVLQKSEWGHDDYSLEIRNLPQPPTTTAMVKDVAEQPKRPTRKFGKGNDMGPMLFDPDAANLTEGK